MTMPLCECGCGFPVKLATQTHAEYGMIRGQPLRFIKGHQGRKCWSFVQRDGDRVFITTDDRHARAVLLVRGLAATLQQAADELGVCRSRVGQLLSDVGFGPQRSRRVHGHTPHGEATPTYRSWRSLRARCEIPGTAGYERYGARGIQVCERWASFENFLADMGPRPAGTSIDRINGDGNYEPSNCRWATSKQQTRNTSYNRNGTAFGRTQCLSDWADEFGLSKSALTRRVNRGVPLEAALTLPRQQGRAFGADKRRRHVA